MTIPKPPSGASRIPKQSPTAQETPVPDLPITFLRTLPSTLTCPPGSTPYRVTLPSILKLIPFEWYSSFSSC